ncbi:TniB family NTP-binding protein [Thalassospira sp.]|uniref:TniB family NTP-binding protein n=1 Tax=Thalassospira sp. TaxID=1912094 RepID=UPI0032EDE2D5
MTNAHTAYTHVHPLYQCLVDEPNSVRIHRIQTEKFISYPHAEFALSKLENLINYPVRSRMPCLLLYGKPGMGKTQILTKFLKSHAKTIPNEPPPPNPVVSFQMPVVPEEKRFYRQLLSALEAPHPIYGTTNTLVSLARKILVDRGTKIILIDEIHAVLAGTPRQQMLIFNTIRYLTNDLRVPIVCAGTREALSALCRDQQLADRFEALELPTWYDGEDFMDLIDTISSTLPLRKPSDLGLAQARQLILERTGGITVRIFRFIEDLACQAILNGTEQILLKDIRNSKITPLASMGV